MRRQFVAVVAASAISAGMTMNAMAAGHPGLHRGLGYGRLHTGLYATGTTGVDRPTGYTEVIMALSAAGASVSVLAFLGTTTDTAHHHITPANLRAQ
jgi:voltage-gated potassium channel Kch